jgi:FdhD protein
LNLNNFLVEEAEVELWVNGALKTTFACTPEALKELAAGHLVCEGMINGLDDIIFEEISSQKVRVRITGEGKRKEKRGAPLCLALTDLQNLAKEMFSRAEIYKRGGGIHCAALSDGTSLLAFKEDIGRQNALDKIVGEALLKGLDPERLVYISSGRINTEIMEKAKNCGFPLVVSRSLVSTLAYQEAKKNGIGLIGRIITPRPIMYNPLGIDPAPLKEQKFA